MCLASNYFTSTSPKVPNRVWSCINVRFSSNDFNDIDIVTKQIEEIPNEQARGISAEKKLPETTLGKKPQNAACPLLLTPDRVI